MSEITIEQLQGLMDAFMTKDLNTLLSYFTEDAVVIDPHYPFPEMRGKAAISAGMTWAFGNMEQPGFRLLNAWLDGEKSVIKVDTHHVFRGGKEIRYLQVFVIETRNGLISHLQSFVPYPPPGISGLLTKLTRWWWSLTGKAKVFRGEGGIDNG